MANLTRRERGWPRGVGAGPAGKLRHDVRIKVNMVHGNRIDLHNTAVVGVRPAPHMVAGRLSTADQQAVFAWIALNASAIIAYWDGDIDTAELIQTLRRV